ncbi:hypothetical protein Q7P37_006361 [Cladosporium fusiforme]
MEAAPPSYEKATLVDYLDLVAAYIPSSDLCSAALVCSRWHTTFSPHIWGNPASHFGIENDRVYVALTKFKRTLQTARLLVRSQTHTLHLPPAHAEIYNGPHSDWLRDVLSRLPNLQSLIVRGLPFFDHAALVALRQSKPVEQSTAQRDPHSFAIELPGSTGSVFQQPLNSIPSFGLRLLDASRCPNVTSSGLAQALRRFESLMYLDLSHTYPARDVSVMGALRRFSGLQVLKLRGISLRDEEIEVLAWAIGRTVRSLDLRDNHVTDRGVRLLLDGCFTTPSSPQRDGNMSVPNGARSPSLLQYLGAEMLETYQSDGFEGFLRGTFTGAFVSRLAIEDAPEGGITHLYISNNKVSVEGASGLIRSGRLHVLDVGTVSGAIERHLSVPDDEGNKPDWQLPGAEKLTPVLYDHARDTLTYLKVDHSLITKDVPSASSDPVIPGRIELDGAGVLPEMPDGEVYELHGDRTAADVFELPTDEQSPRYELEADPMRFVVFPAEPKLEARRGSALAPEAIDNLAEETDTMKLLSPTSPVSEPSLSATGFGTMSTVSPIGAPTVASTPPHQRRPRSLSSAATERTARLNAHRSRDHNLHPAMLPNLRTLVITNFPPFSENREGADRLVRFVHNCAQEAALARSQARLDYTLPPGRKGQTATLRHSANRIFALKKIILEMAPENARDGFGQASPWQHLSTRSMTEDRDSEALWSAAETDFSFFGEEDECAFPSIETGRFAGTMSNEKEVSVGNGWGTPSPRAQSKAPAKPKVDNVAALSAFRKERKLAHQRSLAAGIVEPETEGYWDGAIQVVRPSRGFRDGEELDYYGNKFEKNYLYR